MRWRPETRWIASSITGQPDRRAAFVQHDARRRQPRCGDTLPGKVALMPPRGPQAGMCLVRVELQGDHLLISVTTSTSISHSSYSAGLTPPERFANPEPALAEVARFLDAFSSPMVT